MSQQVQTVHEMYTLVQTDITAGYCLVTVTWPQTFTQEYNPQSSFCHRSSNPDKVNCCFDGGIAGGTVTNNGYQHLVIFNTLIMPKVGDILDVWGLGQTPPTAPVQLSVEVQ